MDNCDDALRSFGLVFVDVIASFDRDGKITPHKIRWETGEVFYVDKVKSVQRAASQRGGAMAIRYTVMMHGKEAYLYRSLPLHGDNIRWYVEAKR